MLGLGGDRSRDRKEVGGEGAAVDHAGFRQAKHGVCSCGCSQYGIQGKSSISLLRPPAQNDARQVVPAPIRREPSVGLPGIDC